MCYADVLANLYETERPKVTRLGNVEWMGREGDTISEGAGSDGEVIWTGKDEKQDGERVLEGWKALKGKKAGIEL